MSIDLGKKTPLHEFHSNRNQTQSMEANHQERWFCFETAFIVMDIIDIIHFNSQRVFVLTSTHSTIVRVAHTANLAALLITPFHCGAKPGRFETSNDSLSHKLESERSEWAVRANEGTEQVAQYLHPDFWLFCPTVLSSDDDLTAGWRRSKARLLPIKPISPSRYPFFSHPASRVMRQASRFFLSFIPWYFRF